MTGKKGVWKGMEDSEDGRKIEDKEDDEETGFCPVDNVKASEFYRRLET